MGKYKKRTNLGGGQLITFNYPKPTIKLGGSWGRKTPVNKKKGTSVWGYFGTDAENQKLIVQYSEGQISLA